MNVIISKKFEPKDGPFYQCLSAALIKLNIDKQAYHGGTFVGNHVNKLLKILLHAKFEKMALSH